MTTRSGLVGLLRPAGFWTVLLVVLAPFMFVFFFMVSTSFKSVVDIQSPEYKWVFWPDPSNYQEVVGRTDFPAAIRNSAIISGAATMVGLLIGIPAAWLLARRAANSTALILGARIIPPISLVIPWFIILQRVGLVDTYAGMASAHTLLVLPIVIWFMVGFFHDLPRDLEEAAFVDGASSLGALVKVVVPVARGAIAAVAVLGFVFSWNNLIYSIALSGSRTKTVTVAMLAFLTDASVEWGSISAAATLMSIPVFVLALVAQRQLIDGLGRSLG